MDGKKTEAVTVKLSADMLHFVEIRAQQSGCESQGEYIRHLIEQDHKKALSDLNLLSVALRIQINAGNEGNA
jgi:hypothetical protein